MASTVWVDTDRCTGCGACVEVCPTGALALDAGVACVNAALCRGCQACVQVCPERAIQPVFEGEIVTTPSYSPVERVDAPLAASPSPSLRQAALGIAVTVGAELARRAAWMLLDAAGDWLSSPRRSLDRRSYPGPAGAARGGPLRRRYRGGR